MRRNQLAMSVVRHSTAVAQADALLACEPMVALAAAAAEGAGVAVVDVAAADMGADAPCPMLVPAPALPCWHAPGW